MSEFDQKKYINEYNKSHYSKICIQIKKEEKEELDELLKKHNLSKATFLRNAIEELKKKN